jgi:hypothetical protein
MPPALAAGRRGNTIVKKKELDNLLPPCQTQQLVAEH